MRLRRLGKFRIATEVLENHTEAVFNLMAAMIPVDVHWDYLSDSFEYTCHSDLFPTLVAGAEPGMYKTIMEDGKLWLETWINNKPSRLPPMREYDHKST